MKDIERARKVLEGMRVYARSGILVGRSVDEVRAIFALAASLIGRSEALDLMRGMPQINSPQLLEIAKSTACEGAALATPA